MEEKAVYAPGELGKVRNNLGNIDAEEAKRMAKLLGGEVGVEKRPAPAKTGITRAPAKTTPKRRVELASDEESLIRKKAVSKKANPSDDPTIPLRQSYIERVKMDRLASEPEFDIKSLGQVFISTLSLFTAPVDYVNPLFITKRMSEYYKKIEHLVVPTRTMFPKSNLKRNEQMKRVSPLAYSILDTIRYWNIERITSDINRMQARPRNIKVSDLADMLRAVYRPLFILENMTPEQHIKGTYKLLYKSLYIENPMEAVKYQELIRVALGAYVTVQRDAHYLLYPLLMKLVSDKCLPYARLFQERRNRIMAFINATEADQISPAELLTKLKEKTAENRGEDGDQAGGANGEGAPNEPEDAAQRAKRVALEAEKHAVDKGLQTLESLFPQAGWEKIAEYPDFFPYFTTVLDIKKGYELIAPTDPMLQFVILTRILEELFFGLRSVSFTSVSTQEGVSESIEQQIGTIVNNWHDYLDESVVKEYIVRLTEYCEVLEGSPEARTSSFAKRILDEMSLSRRLYFLPHYQYAALSSATTSIFHKKEITPLFHEIKKLRRYLTLVAAGIEKGMSEGGAEANAVCSGIENPWKPYVFQVSSSVSKRLDLLLSPKKRNNATLVFFTLAVTTVLDFLVNNEHSWAYNPPSTLLFRSINGEGAIPQFGVDKKINADALFKQRLRERSAAK